jgi:integrase
MAKDAGLAPDDVDFIIGELQHRGILKKAVLAGTRQDRDFPEFLTSFRDYDTSPCVKEKLRKNHGIHRRYCREQSGAVKKYWVPYFSGKLLGEIIRQDVEAFIEHFETLPEREGKPIPKSAKRKNTIIQAGTIALSWAFNKELIDRDVTGGITWFSGKPVERQILIPELAAAVFKVQWTDDRAKLANMLAMVTGIRAGEIQGLRVQDLGQDCLYIRHSWNGADSLKTTKTNENRLVEVPFPELMGDLPALAANNPHGQSMDGYVFWAERKPDKPMEQVIFNHSLRKALIQTVESILRWWQTLGKNTYPDASKLYINNDNGGSNGSRVKPWKKQLQEFANITALEVHVSHFPPGASKWNKIEHRMFCYISKNRRGRPLISVETIIELISNTTTTKGLKIVCVKDKNKYELGTKITDEELAALNITRDAFHGD